MRILAIDDEKNFLAAIARALGAAGHDVTCVADAKSGLDRLAVGRYDLLISDVLMPEMDGLALIKIVRQRHPDLRIIAMSGGGGGIPASVCLKGSEAFGADRILFKPFRMAELLAAVTETGERAA